MSHRDSVSRKNIYRLSVVVMMLFASVLVLQVNLRSGQVRGCKRNNVTVVEPLDQFVRAAEKARRSSGTVDDAHTAEVYAAIARKLEAKLRLDCGKLYPIFPF